jgi:hypothetical protein
MKSSNMTPKTPKSLKSRTVHPCPRNKHGFHHYATSDDKPIDETVLLSFYDKVLGRIHEEVKKSIKND